MTNKQKTDNNKDDNENEAKKKSEDKEKICLSKSFIAISAKSTRERGETRAKYMYRLVRQLKNVFLEAILQGWPNKKLSIVSISHFVQKLCLAGCFSSQSNKRKLQIMKHNEYDTLTKTSKWKFAHLQKMSHIAQI